MRGGITLPPFTLGGYPYTDDLLALEAVSGPSSTPCPAQPLSQFPTVVQWKPYLSSHPDRRFASFLERGFSSGFRIGFNRISPLTSTRRNLSSVIDNPVAVDQYIAEEVAAGKLRCIPNQNPAIHTSPIGLIPKRNRPGKYRLIVDLSSPSGSSVNDGIDTDLCSLKYASVSQAAEMVARLGKGALMAKLDLRAAYRMIPVHQDDQYLLHCKK